MWDGTVILQNKTLKCVLDNMIIFHMDADD